MGPEEAEKPQDDEVIEEVEVVETPVEEGEEANTDTETEEVTENDIVLDGEEGSQPDNQVGIRKRINKLNAKNEVSEAKASDAEKRAALRLVDAGLVVITDKPTDFTRSVWTLASVHHKGN